jgi:hypothetical protein
MARRVGDTWMMMSLSRQDPKIALSNAIKDISTTHFRKSNMDGEVAFFEAPRPVLPGIGAGMSFEQPYGYSWLLKLYGETKGYNNAEGKKMATALAPLARWMSENYVYYLYNLKFPFRSRQRYQHCLGHKPHAQWSQPLGRHNAADGRSRECNSPLFKR